MTPASSTSSFCNPTQFVTVYDWRTIAELLSDTDVALTNQAAVIASPILAELLMEGAGQIEMATSIGNRYKVYTDGTPSDLMALAATSTVSGARLRRLNASITLEYCWRRRPDKEMPPMPEFEESALTLKALSEGEAVFGFAESAQAGLTSEQKDTPTDVQNRNMPSLIAGNLFGRRTNRIWPNGGNW